MERVDRRTARPAKVATFGERRTAEDMLGGLEEVRAGVAVERNKNGNRGEM